MNILIIAPHPDDEVLGCGGTIAKYVAKSDEISVCYVTKPYTPDWSEDYIKLKEIEISKSNSILGISKRFNLDFPAVKLDTIPQKDINDSLYEIISKLSPDYVFIPHHGDINKDHGIVHDAALVALRPVVNSCQCILIYETLSETEWGTYPQSFHPQYYVDISDTLETKIKAMEAFGTELKHSPHPRSIEGIRNLAFKRGSEVFTSAAETFMVVRIIDK